MIGRNDNNEAALFGGDVPTKFEELVKMALWTKFKFLKAWDLPEHPEYFISEVTIFLMQKGEFLHYFLFCINTTSTR